MSVTIKNIYDQALAILGEKPDPDGTHEFAERTPYLAASFCTNVAEIDRDLRDTHGLSAQPDFSEVYLGLESEFPFCERFSAPAAYFVAAMLILDENESLSDSIYEKYCDALARTVSEIPYKKERIANVYS